MRVVLDGFSLKIGNRDNGELRLVCCSTSRHSFPTAPHLRQEEYERNHEPIVLPVIQKFDVFQLKKSYAKNLSLGFAVAVLIYILIIGAYFFLQSVSKSTESEHR